MFCSKAMISMLKRLQLSLKYVKDNCKFKKKNRVQIWTKKKKKKPRKIVATDKYRNCS